MKTKPEELRDRTKRFAILTVKLVQSLPRTDASRVLGKQLLRCATSVAANYRAVGRSRSKAEFISRMAVVVEEADESVFWIEMLCDTDIVAQERVQPLLQEANELLAIFAASHRTARASWK
jgi:four helix bundle protein